MDEEQSQLPEDAAPQRRVLAEGPKEKAEGRTGCILTGAILGIIIGLTFAFYGLPPILRSIYGEDVVELGEAWEKDGRVVQVLEWLALEKDPRQFSVRFTVITDEAWTTEPGDWTLVTDEGDVLELTEPNPGSAGTSLEFAAGENRDLVLWFNELPDTEGEPDYVRLGDPKTRFMLNPDE